MGRRRQKKGRAISGWLILDKPYDFGSTEAVSKIRWLYKAQKAGHAGTLDPLASGMLPIALGEATKTVPYVMDGRKTYQFTVTWGEQRTTDDLEGAVVEQSDQLPSLQDIEAILPHYIGVISQVPPQFSAIKISGERAYDIARSGDAVDIPARDVEIYSLKLLECPDQNTAEFEVKCGKGTYIRSLARDMGQELGCYGYVSNLRRIHVKPFDEHQMIALSDLIALEAIEDDDARFQELDQYLIPSVEALNDMPHIALNDDQAHRVKMGNPVILGGRDAPISEPQACATRKGQLIAIGEVAQGAFKPKRVFNA